MSISAIKFTNKTVQNLHPPLLGRKEFKDLDITGLYLRITSSGTKSFSFRGYLYGKQQRFTIGNLDSMSFPEIKAEAIRIKSLLAFKKDPRIENITPDSKNITLRKCLHDYIKLHTRLADSTKSQYIKEITKYLNDWLDIPLKSISRSLIVHKHQSISKSSESVANRVMRILRALFNYAKEEYEDKNGNFLITDNPVKKLSQQRLWNPTKRKSGSIKPHELRTWFKAVNNLHLYSRYGSDHRDYLLFVLFTGLRKTEGLSLEWKNVDFKAKTFTIIHTKNGKEHTLPLSDFLFKLLKDRHKVHINEYVFPSRCNKSYLKEPKGAVDHVVSETGIKFTSHDLRRTFITIAESLNISTYSVKKLVNHSMTNDVTAGYIMWDVERLREPMQLITDYIVSNSV